MKLKTNAAVNFAVFVLMIVGIFLLSATSDFGQAKISKTKARKIAQAKEPTGKIESEELEKEHGKLVYSFDIRNAKGTITEVQVDARTGKIVSVEEENKQAEEKEKQQEAKEKSRKKT
jgi:competence protein ComGC